MSDYWLQKINEFERSGKIDRPIGEEPPKGLGLGTTLQNLQEYSEMKRFAPKALESQIGPDASYGDYLKSKQNPDPAKRFRDPSTMQPAPALPRNAGEPLSFTVGGERVADPSTSLATEQDIERARERYGDNVNLTEGAPLLDRIATSFMRDTKDRITYYKSQYGDDAVRVAQDENGEDILIIRKPNGEEILVDEVGMSQRDMADMAGYLPEVVGTFVGAGLAGRFGGGLVRKKVMKYILEAAGASAAAQTTGAAQDAIVRVSVGNDIDVPEIAFERGKRAAHDFAADMIMGAGIRVAKRGGNFMLNPARTLKSSYAGVRDMATQSADKIYKLTRGEVDIPLDPATMTESDFVSRMQSFILNMPGGSALKDLIDKQKDSLRDVYKYLAGNAEDLTSFQTGRNVIQVLENKVDNLGQYKEVVRNKVVDSGVRNLNKIYDNASVGRFGKGTYRETVGQAIRDEARLQRRLFKDESNKLFSLAENTAEMRGPIFDMTGFKAVAEQLYQKGLKDVESGGTIDEVLSPTVKKFIDIARKSDNKVNYLEIKDLRGTLNDAFAQDSALGDYTNRQLSQLSETLTASVSEAGGNKEVQKALRAANTFYSKHAKKFQTNLFEKIHKDPRKGGIANADLASSLIKGRSENYDELMELMGHSPDAQNLIKRTVVNDLIERFSDGNTVNASEMLRFISDPEKANRKVIDDVFGKKKFTQLKQELKLLEKVNDPRVKSSDLEDLIASGNVSRARVEKLIKARKQEESVYRNTIIKQVLDGDVDAFNPQEFVDKALVSGNVDELGKVMQMIRGTQAEVDFKRKVIQKYFYSAAKKEDPEDFAKAGVLIDPNRMKQLLKGDKGGIKDAKQKLETILSEEEMDLFNNLVNVSAATGVSSRTGKVAGGLAAGGLINSMITSGPLRTMTSTVKYAFAAHMITNPVTLQWLRNNAEIGDLPDISRYVLTSPTFIAAVLNDGNYEREASRLFYDFDSAYNVPEEEKIDLTPANRNLRPPAATRTY